MAVGGRTYLDHNATSPIRPEVAEAVARALVLPGNPSSVHAEGRAARAEIEAAREKVAALVGAEAKNVVFTSGGTEANNTVLARSLRGTGRDGAALFLFGATEHPSVMEGHRFPTRAAERIPVNEHGEVDLLALEARLDRAGEPALVSIQVANNETGTIQPIAKAAEIVHERGGLMHSDAVQAAGKLPVSLAALGVDVISLSAHKMGGPKGVGAIILNAGTVDVAERLLRGGGQERGRRAGTENVAAIAGFGVAADLVARTVALELARLGALRDKAEARLRQIAPDAVVFGSGASRLPNTLAFAVPGLKAETALIAFDLAGIAVSSGSACSSGRVRPSHVLEAMGVEPALAACAIRVSLGWNSTLEDVTHFADTCEKVAATLYKRRANVA